MGGQPVASVTATGHTKDFRSEKGSTHLLLEVSQPLLAAATERSDHYFER